MAVCNAHGTLTFLKFITRSTNRNYEGGCTHTHAKTKRARKMVHPPILTVLPCFSLCHKLCHRRIKEQHKKMFILFQSWKWQHTFVALTLPCWHKLPIMVSQINFLPRTREAWSPTLYVCLAVELGTKLHRNIQLQLQLSPSRDAAQVTGCYIQRALFSLTPFWSTKRLVPAEFNLTKLHYGVFHSIFVNKACK